MFSKVLPLLLVLVGDVEGFQSLAPTTTGPKPFSTHLSVTPASDYEMDDFVNDRPYRRGSYYDGGESFRVGGRPVDGHRVIRSNRPFGPRRTERGPHMDVTTANPSFVRTDRRDGRPGDFRYGPAMPNTQDLVGMGRMPMQSEEWDRYRYNRDRPSRFRSTRTGGRMPHFIADEDDVGLPIDPALDEELEDEMVDGGVVPPVRGGRRGDTMREREMRDLEERRRARRGGAVRLYNPGLRGYSWEEDDYPERRGRYGRGRRYYADRRRDGLYDDDDMDYDDVVPLRRRAGMMGPRARRYYDNDRDMDVMSRRDEFEEDDYVRDGPYMVRGRYSRRGGVGPRREGDMMDAEVGYDRDRFFPRRNRGMYGGASPRMDEPGSMGGPMEQDLFGRDSRYTSRQQGWRSGTSMDVIY